MHQETPELGIPWLCGECSGTSLFRGHKKPVLWYIYGLSNARAAHAGARSAVCKLEGKKNRGGFAGTREWLLFYFSLGRRDLLLRGVVFFLRVQNLILFSAW